MLLYCLCALDNLLLANTMDLSISLLGVATNAYSFHLISVVHSTLPITKKNMRRFSFVIGSFSLWVMLL